MRSPSLIPWAVGTLAVVPVAGAAGVTLAPWAAAVTGALAGAVAGWVAARGVRRDGALLALAALLGWALVLVLLRPVDPTPAAWTIAGGAVALVGAAAAQRPRAQLGARVGAGLAGVAAALYLVVERVAEGGRPGGPLAHPGMAATLALLGLALLPAVLPRTGAKVLVGGVLVAGIVASGSRAAMLGAVALALSWGLQRTARGARWVAVAVAVLALAGLAVRLRTDVDPLRWERVRIWQVALQTAVAQAPWGAGPGGFADAALKHNFPREGELARFYREPSVAESDLLQLAASLGVVGVGLGAALAVGVLRRVTWVGVGVVVALVVTSAVSTQLPVPAVAIAASLAVAGTLRRPRGELLGRVTPAQALAGGVLVAVGVGLALSWPRPGIAPDAAKRAEEARQLAEKDPATATLAAAEAVRLRPQWAEGRRLLASLYWAQGVQRREAALLERAAESFAAAGQLNHQDAFAAYGEAECAFTLGERHRAHLLAHRAVRTEPNFARAWLLLGALELAEGRVDEACTALAQAQASARAAAGVTMISQYERELVRWNGGRAAVLASACGTKR